MSNMELSTMDGRRSGLRIEANADEAFEEWLDELPASEPEPRYAPVFTNIFAAHFGGAATQIRPNNARQAFGGGTGHFPGKRYGDGGERR